MLVGYARTSTAEQEAGFAAQERDLKHAGCERLFSEQVSSVAQRLQLAAALDFVRDGDKLIVTRLDRAGAWHGRPAGDRRAAAREGCRAAGARSGDGHLDRETSLPDRYMPAWKTATARASSSAFSRGSIRPTPPIPRSRSSWTIIRRMCRRKPTNGLPLSARAASASCSRQSMAPGSTWSKALLKDGALGLASHPGGFESRTQATDHGIPRRPQSPACCPHVVLQHHTASAIGVAPWKRCTRTPEKAEARHEGGPQLSG